MSEIENELSEVDKSLKKIQNLSYKLKRHYLHRQNTRKQIKTLNKFITLEEFISRRLSILSKTQTEITVLTKLNSHIDDLQAKVNIFESSLDDEYWKKYQQIQFDKFKFEEIQFNEKTGQDSNPSNLTETTIQSQSTTSSATLTSNSCKCLIF